MRHAPATVNKTGPDRPKTEYEKRGCACPVREARKNGTAEQQPVEETVKEE